MNHFCKEVPIIVVGCKTDLRKDRSLVKKLRKKRLEPVTYHRVGTQPRRRGAGRGALCQAPRTLRVWGRGGVISEVVVGQELLTFGGGA